MKKTLPALRLGEAGTYEEVFRQEEEILLTVQARWPRLEGEGPGCRRIDRYYDALAQQWLRRCKGPLLERAKAAHTPGLSPWRARLDFTVTLFQEGFFSLYWDAVEEVGQRRPRRFREGDVWRLPEGIPVTLWELLPPKAARRKAVLTEVRRQIGERTGAGEAAFWDNWEALAGRKFSPGRFYLTAEGPVVFYPVESIAPAMEGFPTFPLGRLLEPAEKT